MTLSPFDERSLWRVEEACCNAYPAWREAMLDGWLLRAAGGATRRINSVNPLRGGSGDPAAIVEAATAFYTRLGQRVLFRVPTLVPDMAASLDRQGFSGDGEVLTLAAALMPGDVAPATTLSDRPDAGWLDAWAACRPDADEGTKAAFRRAIGSLLVPAAFLSRFDETAPAAVAYVAVHRGIAILEAVVTHPAHRQRGHARAIVTAAAAWAHRVGAEAICLQVAADNDAARSLYQGLGFRTELYRYHYRSAPERH